MNYWSDPSGNIHRMDEEGTVIARVTKDTTSEEVLCMVNGLWNSNSGDIASPKPQQTVSASAAQTKAQDPAVEPAPVKKGNGTLYPNFERINVDGTFIIHGTTYRKMSETEFCEVGLENLGNSDINPLIDQLIGVKGTGANVSL